MKHKSSIDYIFGPINKGLKLSLFGMLLSTTLATAQEKTPSCELYYSPVLEIKNKSSEPYSDWELYYILDREKFLAKDQLPDLTEKSAHRFQFPVLQAELGLHILEVYASFGTTTKHSSTGIQVGFEEDQVKTSESSIFPIQVYKTTNAKAKKEAWISADGKCACLSGDENSTPVATLWYNYTKDALGTTSLFVSLDNGASWVKASKQELEDDRCFEYMASVKLLSGDISKINFFPETQKESREAVIIENLEAFATNSIQASPNPFSTTTTLSYNLPYEDKVSITLYNLQGVPVRTFLNETKSAGTHQAILDGTGLSTGIYLCVLKTSDKSSNYKLIYSK